MGRRIRSIRTTTHQAAFTLLVAGALIHSSLAHADSGTPRSRAELIQALRPSPQPATPLAGGDPPDANGRWATEFAIPELDGTPQSAVYWNDDLIVGGNFTCADGQPVANVARWDGSAWQPMGDGLDYTVRALAIWRGRVVAGGSFYRSGWSTTGPLVLWNGSTWQGVQGTPFIAVDAIATSDSEMVVGGRVSDGRFRIARWDGSSWSSLGDPFEGVLSRIVSFRGEWVIGGAFDSLQGEPVHNIARWDGADWRPLEGGLTGMPNQAFVLDLAAFQDQLLVGGGFDHAGTVPVSALARWTGTEWQAIPGAPSLSYAVSLATDDTTAFVSGWDNQSYSTSRTYLWRWNGGAFVAEPGLSSSAEVLAVTDGRLAAAGFFYGAEVPTHHVTVRETGAWKPVFAWHAPMRGLNGEVRDLERFEGRIVAAGAFDFAAADHEWRPLSGVGVWTGDGWEPMPGPTWGGTDLEVHGGALYLANGQLLRWNGTSWDLIGQPSGGPIVRLQSHGGALWATSTWPSYPPGSSNLWRVGSATWDVIPIPSGIPADSAFSTALGVHDGRLVVAWAWGEPWRPKTRLAMYDGATWELLPGQFEGRVDALASFDGKLCAGGDFFMSGADVRNFAVFTDGGWVGYGPWLPNVTGMKPVGTKLALAGSGLSFFDGSHIDQELIGASWVTALAVDGSSLWIGGGFASVAGHTSSRIARYDGFPGLPPAPISLTWSSIEPNPSFGSVALHYATSRSGRIGLTIHDLAGRKVFDRLEESGGPGKRMFLWNGEGSDGRSVPSGVYFARLSMDGQRSEVRRIVRLR